MTEPIYSQRIFIGRKEELDILNEWLSGAKSSEWFMAITGSGGIGKSQLIENFIEKNSEPEVLITVHPIDLYWTAHQTEVGILRSLASQLGTEAHFSSFHELLDKDGHGRDIADEVREAFFDGYKQLGQRKTLLVFDTMEEASDAAIRFFLQTAPQLESINPNTRLLAAGRWLPGEGELADCDFVKELPLVGLSRDNFSGYLSEVVKGRKVPDDVVKRVHAVTDGRPMWAGLFADWINTGNKPRAINTASLEAFKENVLQSVAELQEPEDTVILAMAHLSRRCNENILSCVLYGTADKLGIDISKAVENLSHFSFVKYRKPVGDDLGVCLLHDEMRDLVYKHLWGRLDPSGNYRKNWSSKAIAYYDEEIQRVRATPRPNILDLHVLNAERLYYLFHVNPDEAFDCYRQLFAQARSTDVLEELNEEVDLARKAFDIKLSKQLEGRYRLNLAMVDHRRERYATAAEQLATLDYEMNNDPDCELELIANARWRLVMAHTMNGDVKKAIERGTEWEDWLRAIIQNTAVDDDLHKALTRQLASLHSQLGQANRKQGSPDLAVKHYNKALELYYKSDPPRDEVANTRINLAGAYLELGQPTKSFEQARAAQRAYKAIGDPYHLGRVYNVLGLIHDGVLQEEAAQEHFDEALKYFQEARNRRGQGMCLVAQARMLRREQSYKEKYEEVKPTTEKSEKMYEKIGDLIDAAIAKLKGGDLALLAIAFNEKGTLLRERKRFDEAIQLFRESNEIAKKIDNTHRIADNLQDIAQSYYYKGELDEAIAIAKEAVDYGYPQPSGRARRTIANVLFRRGDYDGAFETICRSCAEIVQVDTGSLSDSPFRRDRLYGEWIVWVKKLLHQLTSLTSVEEKERRRRQLINCWNESRINGEPLSVSHPDFISVLENLADEDN